MIRRDFMATGVAAGAALMGASQTKGNGAKFEQWLYERKCRLVIGMERDNSKPGKEGGMAVIVAYRESDSY